MPMGSSGVQKFKPPPPTKGMLLGHFTSSPVVACVVRAPPCVLTVFWPLTELKGLSFCPVLS